VLLPSGRELIPHDWGLAREKRRGVVA